MRDKYFEGMRTCLLLAAMRHILWLNLTNKLRTRNAHSSSEYSSALEGKKWYLQRTVSGPSCPSGLPGPFPHPCHDWDVSKPLLTGPDPDLLQLDPEPVTSPWTSLIDGTPSWVWQHLQPGCRLIPCVVPKLNQQNKGGYLDLQPFQRLIRRVSAYPGWSPTAQKGWDDGFSTETSRVCCRYSPCPATVRCRAAAPENCQDPTTAVLLCVIPDKEVVKEAGWHPGTVKLGALGTPRDFMIQFYKIQVSLL